MASSNTLNIVAAGAVAFSLWTISSVLLQHYFVERFTGVNDLPDVGTPRPLKRRKITGTAVVCGGSIAGLLAARVCADHFERVIVCEPETWPSVSLASNARKATLAGSTPDVDPIVETKEVDGVLVRVNRRSRIPQYHAVHTYQPFSLFTLRGMFPCWDAELTARDARIGPNTSAIFLSGIRLPSSERMFPGSNMPPTIFSTRDTLERLIRDLVKRDHHNIEFITGTVTELVPSSDKERIERVTVRKSDKEQVEIPCSLVLDCTGPTQGGIKWLRRAGCDVPQRVEYDPSVRYVCMDFPVPSDIQARLPLPGGYAAARWLFGTLPIAAFDHKSAMVGRYERDRMMFVFGGWGKPALPRNQTEILDYMQTLKFAPGLTLEKWIPDCLAIIAEKEPIVNVYHAAPPALVRYDQIRTPSNFIALGDAVMKLNPVCPHGINKCCLGAVTLDRLLRRSGPTLSDTFSKDFFSLQHERTIGSWEQSKNHDYAFSTTTPIHGEEDLQAERIAGSSNGAVDTVMKRVMKISLHDADIARTIWSIRNGLAPKTNLYHPSIIAKGVLSLFREAIGLQP